MNLRQDRQGARTPAELERKYKFKKNISKAINTAEEAKKVATSVSETDKGLELKVESLEKDVAAKLEMTVQRDENGNLVSELHIGAGKMTVDTDNFKLNEDGTIEAHNAVLSGSVTAQDTASSVTLDEGRVKIISPAHIKGLHHYVPLVEFTFNGEPKVLVADFYNREGWVIAVMNGSFLDFSEPEKPI